jgi:hypothetical protein
LWELIETFEAQSGSSQGETDATLAQIRNITVLPEPEAHPISSSKANMDFIAEVRKLDKETKRTTKVSPTLKAVHEAMSPLQSSMESLLQAMQHQTNAILQSNTQILEAMKTQPQAPTLIWTPLIQAVVTAIPAIVGVPITPVTSAQPTQTTAAPVSTSTDPTFLSQGQISQLFKISHTPPEVSIRMDKMETSLSQLANSLEGVTSTLNSLASTVSQLSQGFNTLAQIVAASSGVPSSNSNGPQLQGVQAIQVRQLLQPQLPLQPLLHQLLQIPIIPLPHPMAPQLLYQKLLL